MSCSMSVTFDTAPLVYTLTCTYCKRDKTLLNFRQALEQENEMCWRCESGILEWIDRPDTEGMKEAEHLLKTLVRQVIRSYLTGVSIEVED